MFTNHLFTLACLAWFLVSAPAQADESFRLTPPLSGDQGHFNASSDQNGVCKLLGYERAAVGSTETSNSSIGLTIVVNAKGEPLRATLRAKPISPANRITTAYARS